MEQHCSKDSAIATRIFELGMGRFGERAEYVIEHLRFLIELNDDQSMCTLVSLNAQTFLTLGCRHAGVV